MIKVIKTLRLITVLAGMTVLFGCSTKLTVTSEPEGALMSFKGKEKMTPFV